MIVDPTPGLAASPRGLYTLTVRGEVLMPSATSR